MCYIVNSMKVQELCIFENVLIIYSDFHTSHGDLILILQIFFCFKQPLNFLLRYGNIEAALLLPICPEFLKFTSHGSCSGYCQVLVITLVPLFQSRHIPRLLTGQHCLYCVLPLCRLWHSPHCWPYHFLINFSVTLFPWGHGQFLDPPSSLVFWPSPFRPTTRSRFLSGQTLRMGNRTWAFPLWGRGKASLHISGMKIKVQETTDLRITRQMLT